MDRRRWLDGRRAAVLATYEGGAETYEAHGYPIEAQRRFVARLLESCPPGGIVLDAPCGTGIYFEMVAASGRRVVGIDQSPGMLTQARRKGIAESLAQVGLQALAFDGQFDAVMTVDAMENVCPEDWPVVLANLRRALRVGGHLYLTVEEIEEARIDEALAALAARGLPAVRGEVVEGDVAGYHYYPGRERVLQWLAAEGLEIVDEAYEPEDGWGYRHFLLRTRVA
jgi:ubiquinone/menaquinone biosynthesis C-methylase UbiE